MITGGSSSFLTSSVPLSVGLPERQRHQGHRYGVPARASDGRNAVGGFSCQNSCTHYQVCIESNSTWGLIGE